MGGCHYGELVAALILEVVVVAFYPFEVDFVLAVYFEEAHPEVGVLFSGESFFLPAEYPAFLDSIDDVFGVGDDEDGHVWGFELFESDDDAEEFHAVVGGVAEAFVKFFSVGCSDEFHDYAVATWTGVSFGSAVCIDVDLVGHLIMNYG